MLTTGVSSKMRAHRAPRQRGEAVDISAAVDLERFGVVDAVEITIGLERRANAIDLPALGLGVEILIQHLQPADQPIAGIDVGDLEHAVGEADIRHVFFAGIGAHELGALLGEHPQFDGVLEADALDQLGERQRKTGHHRAELVAGGVPADMAAFEHRDASPEPGRLKRDGKAREPCPDNADIGVKIEGQPDTLAKAGFFLGHACESLAHSVS
ncbi:hypothetical protein ACVWZ4_004904 [Bradyrhizobium sp. USDA 4472]